MGSLYRGTPIRFSHSLAKGLGIMIPLKSPVAWLHFEHPLQGALMRTWHFLLLVVALAPLVACVHLEQIRSSPRPSDHCLACSDLGEAWALFGMGDFEQVETYCTMVIDAEASADSYHAQRARDISLLAKGSSALRSDDYSSAQTLFRSIRDPQLRALGCPSLDGGSYAYLASTARERRH